MVRVPVSLNTSKVIVAFNKVDLFLKGYYTIEENPASEILKDVNLTGCVFENQAGIWFDAEE